MTRITMDQPLKDKLGGLSQRIEICDENGNVVGHFLPEKVYKRMICDMLGADVSREELERRLAEPGGSTLDEILARLENS